MTSEELKKIPLIDTHAHRIHPGRMPEGLWRMTFCIPEKSQEVHAKNTIFYRFMMTRLGRYFGLPEDASYEEILAERNRRFDADPAGYFRTITQEKNVACYLMENGSPMLSEAFTPEEIAWFDSAIPKEKQRSMVRIERQLDDMLPEKLSFEELLNRFERDFPARIKAENATGIKTCIAYYGGFDIRHRSTAQAKAAYEKLITGDRSQEVLQDFYQYFLYRGIDYAKQFKLPVQFHTGQGAAKYLNYTTLNPNYLVPLITDPEIYDQVKLVLLHAGHPYEEHTSHLALQFPHVYTDFSGVIWFSCANALPRLRALLERAPFDKVMYGSDSTIYPEFYWYCPDYFREVLGKLLTQYEEEGYLRASEVPEVAERIMYKNALAVYPGAGI